MAASLARVSLLAHHVRALTSLRPRGPAGAPSPRFVAVVMSPGGSRTLGSLTGVRGSMDGVQQGDQSDAAAAVPRSVPARVAYELQQAGHRYLDVRTEGEFLAGHPERAVNIPYMFRTDSGMTKNTHFLEQVSRTFGKGDEIILGCQSGRRSLMAATDLYAAGFTTVTDVAGGFSSWKENGLPVNK